MHQTDWYESIHFIDFTLCSTSVIHQFYYKHTNACETLCLASQRNLFCSFCLRLSMFIFPLIGLCSVFNLWLLLLILFDCHSVVCDSSCDRIKFHCDTFEIWVRQIIIIHRSMNNKYDKQRSIESTESKDR